MKKRQITYVEPADYFPKEIREKYGLGEYADKMQKSKISDKCAKQDKES